MDTMLNKEQREYLRASELDLAEMTKGSRRRGIQQRIKNTWMEHSIAFENTSLEDSAQLVLRR